MSTEHRRSAEELRALFQKFTSAMSTDSRLSHQLTAWLQARRSWRSQWANRSPSSPEHTFQRLIPNPAGHDLWVHPIAEEAPELDAWRTEWETATLADRKAFASAFVRAIEVIERDPTAAPEACAQLARSAGARGLPLAAFTPALSSLEPTRFVVVSDAGLRMLSQYQEVPVPSDVAVYPDISSTALRWLAAAEGDSLEGVLGRHPPADRFGVFCSWVLRTASDASAPRTFDVTRKKYKEWPPMW
ncbi:MAG: hypothetical protein ABIS29_02355 [Vicinamibacterales bacterium]